MFRSPFSTEIQFALVNADSSCGMRLHADEMSLMEAYCATERACDFWLGRVAAQLALHGLQCRAPVLRHADGRPRWPLGIVGSITHAAGWGAAAVARHASFRGIGLDIESLDATIDLASAPLIAHPDEVRWIGRDRARFICLLSAKEAVFKALDPLAPGRLSLRNILLQPIGTGFLVAPGHLAVHSRRCGTMVMHSVTL